MLQRPKKFRTVVVGVSVFLLLGATFAQATSVESSARTQLTGLRLPFIANDGQVDARVAYYAPTFEGTLFVTRQGTLVHSLPAPTSGSPRGRRAAASRPGWTLTQTLLGGRAHPAGQDPSATGISYFVGAEPARWRSQVPTYDQLSLGEVWPGVTVSLQTRARSTEEIFTIHPGASVARIRVRVDGATTLALDSDGALIARTGLGPVTFSAPVAYQEVNGERRPVAVTYRLRGREYGFVVGPHDPALPLVIDPLLQSTYLGGNGADAAFALAIHPMTHDIYLAGSTLVSNFPGTAGGAQPIRPGQLDGFVARLNSKLTVLTQATYLGGGDFDEAVSIAIHPGTGDVYVAGQTASPDFPHGPIRGAQAVFGGGFGDGFVARLNASLTAVLASTYLGGTGLDDANAVAIHPATGDVYVAGDTSSINFPHTSGGAQAVLGGSTDAFVARLTSDLTVIHRATYLGGSFFDQAVRVAIHPTTGDVYVAGTTLSANFPGTTGGAQPTYGGGTADGFVARLNSTLTALIGATYLGGSGHDEPGGGFAIHPKTGDVYVTGFTDSLNFPATAGGAQPVSAGGNDAFVARLKSTLTAVIQATYLGGGGNDEGLGLAIHPKSGEIYVTGDTVSTDFPGTTGGAQSVNAGSLDAFVARLNHALTALIQATYLGGSGVESVGRQALAIHPKGHDVYVAGSTNSTDFPGTAGGAQPIFGGGTDNAFVTVLTSNLEAGP